MHGRHLLKSFFIALDEVSVVFWDLLYSFALQIVQFEPILKEGLRSFYLEVILSLLILHKHHCLVFKLLCTGERLAIS
jgi:hypothetical protein